MSKKILLGMLSYWTPLVPPQGIGMLKAYLKRFDHHVDIFDYNINEKSDEFYQNYFKLLGDFIPKQNKGNFHNIGHDVLHNHMMAAIKFTSEDDYIDLVKELIYHTFYFHVTSEQIILLNNFVHDFYADLEKYCLDLLKNHSPEIIGLSVFKGNLPASIFFARISKKHNPKIKIAMGGGIFADSHSINSPSFFALEEETKDCVDLLIVASQGEKIFKEFVDEKLTGIRVTTMNDLSLTPLEFKDLTIADFSSFDVSRYPYIVATGSTSCPNQCSFCNGTKFYGEHRKKPTDQLIEEMDKMYALYGNQLFFFSDSLLNTIVEDLSTELIAHNKHYYYDCYFRVDLPSAELENTIKWRRSGLYRTRLGIESGSQKVLDLMHKDITIQQSKNALKSLALAGVKTTAYFVIGHPDETEKDFQLTLDYISEMKDYMWEVEANPFYYHYNSQTDSDSWSDKRKLLYTEKMRNMLVFDTWTLNSYPLREERYNRLRRFTYHCDMLGIMNPYTAIELHNADLRWSKLHKNAVPSIWEFEKFGNIVTEATDISMINRAGSTMSKQKDIAFNF